MAKQIGIVKLTGMLDDLVFYEHPEDGALVRKRTTVTAEKMKASPTYQQTLDNAAEFANSITGGQLLRKAFRELLFPIADGKLSSRMNKVMLEILQQDKVNNNGERVAQEGNLVQLEGFEFNRHMELNASLLARYTVVTDPDTGQIHIDIPSFVPARSIVANSYVKAMKLVSGVAVIDFAQERYSNSFWQTEMITLDKEPVEGIRFSYPFTLVAGQTLFLVLGLQHWVHMDELPKSDISKRKYWLVRRMRDDNKMMPFTGSLCILKAVAGAGEPEVNLQLTKH